MPTPRSSSSIDQLDGAASVIHNPPFTTETSVPLDEATDFAKMLQTKLDANKAALSDNFNKLKTDPGIEGEARNGLLLAAGIVAKYLATPPGNLEEIIAEFGVAGTKGDKTVNAIMNPIKGKETVQSLLDVLDRVADLTAGADVTELVASLSKFNEDYKATRLSPKWGVKAAALTEILDRVASELENSGHKDLASNLDVVSNTLAAMEETDKPITEQVTPSLEQNNTTQETPMSNKYAMLKQAHEMQAQAYDLLAKASGIIDACGYSPVGDPSRAQVVAPAAPSVVVTTDGTPVAPASPMSMPGTGGDGVIMLELSQKTASLAILDKVAAELASSKDPGLRKLASEVLSIAADLDKTAKVIEDGFSGEGVIKKTDKLVNELEKSYKGGVLEDGTGGGQGGAAVQSFKTDKSYEVQNLPFVKRK